MALLDTDTCIYMHTLYLGEDILLKVLSALLQSSGRSSGEKPSDFTGALGLNPEQACNLPKIFWMNSVNLG